MAWKASRCCRRPSIATSLRSFSDETSRGAASAAAVNAMAAQLATANAMNLLTYPPLDEVNVGLQAPTDLTLPPPIQAAMPACQLQWPVPAHRRERRRH